jgi:antitoxin component YwqK of YwqJK toxin-antitoxin module
MKINFKQMKNNNLIFLIILALISNFSFSQIVKKEYYKNGKLFRKFQINKKGLKNGYDFHYFENGTISEKKKWLNNKLTDSIFTYDDKGKIITKGSISEKGLLKLYRNNILEYEGTLEEDKLKGIVVYFKDDNVVLSKTFENDKENGFNVLLDEKSLKPKFMYETNDNVRDGVLVSFYENGIIKTFRSKSLNSKKSQYFEFHPNGVLKSIGYMNFGMYEGYVYFFYDTGKIERKIYYHNGKEIDK